MDRRLIAAAVEAKRKHDNLWHVVSLFNASDADVEAAVDKEKKAHPFKKLVVLNPRAVKAIDGVKSVA